MNQPRYPAKTILSVARTIHANAEPHVDQLSIFGIDADSLSAFAVEIEVADFVPTSDARRIALRERTIDKDELLEACTVWCSESEEVEEEEVELAHA